MPNPKTLGLDLTQGSIAKQMAAFALPMMIATALQQVYGMVDMVIMGQFVGSAGLSAVSIGSQAVSLMTCLCIGFSGGAQVIISQYVGAGKKRELNSIIGTTFSIHIIAALLAAAVSLLLCGPFLRLLSTPAESFAGAASYLIICSIGLVFVYGYNMVAAVLRGMGDSRRPLVFIAVASVINILLDLLFIGVFHMDAAGAALATVLSQAISFVISLLYLYRRKEGFGFDFKLKSLRIQRDTLKNLLRLGIPQALQMAAIQISFLFISANVNGYGVTASAAFGVGQKIEHIPSIATQGFSNAVAAMVGQNFGAQKFDRIKKTTHVALIISAAAYVFFGVLYLFIPEQLFRLFTGDAEVLALSRTILWAMLLAYPANILMNAYRGVTTGVGNASLGLAMGLLDGVILRVGLALLFGSVLDMGLVGFIMGYSLAAYGTAIPSAIYYWSGLWKKRRSLVSAPDSKTA